VGFNFGAVLPGECFPEKTIAEKLSLKYPSISSGSSRTVSLGSERGGRSEQIQTFGKQMLLERKLGTEIARESSTPGEGTMSTPELTIEQRETDGTP
jgi:hypothetical protein